MKCLSFLFQQKRNSKIGACEDLALCILYSTRKKKKKKKKKRKKKNYPFFIELLLKSPCLRINGILEKIDFEKNEKTKFLMQYMSLFEISLLIYLILLHYSSDFINSLYVDILCLNCGHDSSYVDVTSCRICFINFLFSSGNKITFIDFCLFKMLV